VDSDGPKEACVTRRNLVNTIEPSVCGGGDAALRRIALTTCRTTATTSGVRSIGPSTSRYAHVPLTQSYVLQQEPGRPVARRTTRFLSAAGQSTSVQLASPLHRHLYHQSHTSIHTCTTSPSISQPRGDGTGSGFLKGKGKEEYLYSTFLAKEVQSKPGR